MRRIVLLSVGWILTAAGLIVTPLPPPFAFGIFLLAAGLIILTANSKTVRRWVQYARHHHGWLSRAFERLTHRHTGAGAATLRGMIRRTNPHALARFRRMRAQRTEKRADAAAGLPSKPQG